MERMLLLFALLMVPAWVCFLLHTYFKAQGKAEQAKTMGTMAFLLLGAYLILMVIAQLGGR